MNTTVEYNKPSICPICEGNMEFKGVGEYKCKECGRIEYDDYGKVRGYIEKYSGANAAQIEAATGVSQRVIRQLLRESRIEIANGATTFLRCEKCGKPIRSGILCEECERHQ